MKHTCIYELGGSVPLTITFDAPDPVSHSAEVRILSVDSPTGPFDPSGLMTLSTSAYGLMVTPLLLEMQAECYDTLVNLRDNSSELAERVH